MSQSTEVKINDTDCTLTESLNTLSLVVNPEILFCPDCGNKSATEIDQRTVICNTTVKYRCSCGCEFFRDY